jgi:hypothetical protein
VSQYGAEKNPAEKFEKDGKPEKTAKNEKYERIPASSQRS